MFSALIATLLAFLAIFPLFRVLSRFIWSSGLDLAPLRDTLNQPDLGEMLLTTTFVVAVSGVLALTVGAVFAWLNERTDARLGFVTDSMPLMNLLLPPIAGAIGWLLLLSPRGGYLNWAIREVVGLVGIHMEKGPFEFYSLYSLIFLYVIQLVPFSFLIVSAGLRNLDPALEEQSWMCGGGTVRTLWRVTLPALKPSLGASAFLMIWAGLGMFSIPVIVAPPAGIEILSVRIVRLMRYTYPPEVSAAVGLSVFVMLALGATWYLQRRSLTNQRFGTVAGKSARTTRIELGRWRSLARAWMLSYLFCAVVLPFGALLVVSLNGYWTLNIAWGGLGLDAFRRSIFENVTTFRSLSNSIRLAFATATIGMFVAALLALWVQRTRGRGPRVLDGLIKLPAAVSSTLIAVGFVLAFAGPPFGLAGTLMILMLAYLVLSMPEASVIADASVGQVSKELSEASFMSSATPTRTFGRVVIPLMVPGLLAGWALLYVRVVADVNAAALLASSANIVVGFRLLDVYQNGTFATVAAIAMAITVASSTVVLTVMSVARLLSGWTRSSLRAPTLPGEASRDGGASEIAKSESLTF